jgi:hypothetical protein
MPPSRVGPYLAGLIEGNGRFYVPANVYSAKGRKNTGYIEIVFSKLEIPFATYLKSRLGGYVYAHPIRPVCSWKVSSNSDLPFVANLINGHMRTPKIDDLTRLIDYYHSNFPTLKFDCIKPIDHSPLDSNAWLAGMWDAKGDFDMTMGYSSNIKNRFSVNIRAYIVMSTYYYNARFSNPPLNYLIHSAKNKISKIFKTSTFYF